MDGHVIDTRIEVKRPISDPPDRYVIHQMSEIQQAVGMYAHPRHPDFPNEFDDGSLHKSNLIPLNGLWILVRGSLVSDNWVRRRRIGWLY